MRGPKPPAIVLTADDRRDLEALVRRHTTAQQIALRGRIVLAAADGRNNAEIARFSTLSAYRAALARTLALPPVHPAL